jgi:hypothetical protein
MTRRPFTARALACLGAALILSACSDEPTADDDPISVGQLPTPTASAVPSAAGGSAAAALEPLPAGRATGSVLVTYEGLGELRAPFTGECTHDGPVTEFRGTADGADIVLTFGPDGATLAVDDVGLRSTAALADGTIEVDGDSVALQAPLLEGGQVIGAVELDADCAA